MAAFELSTYKEVVKKALVIERDISDIQFVRERALKKRSRPRHFQGQDNRNPNAKRKNSALSRKKVRCYRCGGPHY